MHLTAGAYVWLLVIGCLIGVCSGMLGIGGGVLVIPALMFIFGFAQQTAVGTSLGMLLPPIGIFAFLHYYQSKEVHLPAAGLLALGFAVGAYLGAVLVTKKIVPTGVLRPLFAFFLLYVAGNMLFRSEGRVAAALYTILKTAGLMIGFAASFVFLHALGKRWERKISMPEIYRERVEGPLAPDYEI
jgi:uncharacterized membrane protein YfcA